MATIQQELQVLNQVNGFVELHILDCSNIGGVVHYFTPNVYSNGDPVVWNGNSYTFIPIQSMGWELTTSGSLPQPTVTISNVNKQLLTAVITLGDIVGATYTRYRTFSKFLDGQSDANPSQYVGPDSYIVYQKTSHDKNQISWQLSSVLDKPNMKLPARQCLKDVNFPGISRYRSGY